MKMGCNASRNSSDVSQGTTISKKKKSLPKKASKLTESDFKFLTSETGLSKEEIKEMFDKFNSNNTNGHFNKKEFVHFYAELKSEAPELIDDIAELIFNAYDTDKNGLISFDEFIIGYALTSRADQKKKLEYLFEIYDADKNGYLIKDEVREVINAMLYLLDANNKNSLNLNDLVKECFKELDSSDDGKITKDEFIDGLMKNPNLQELMSPFHF